VTTGALSVFKEILLLIHKEECCGYPGKMSFVWREWLVG
jgi:hypothetical protein